MTSKAAFFPLTTIPLQLASAGHFCQGDPFHVSIVCDVTGKEGPVP